MVCVLVLGVGPYHLQHESRRDVDYKLERIVDLHLVHPCSHCREQQWEQGEMM